MGPPKKSCMKPCILYFSSLGKAAEAISCMESLSKPTVMNLQLELALAYFKANDRVKSRQGESTFIQEIFLNDSVIHSCVLVIAAFSAYTSYKFIFKTYPDASSSLRRPPQGSLGACLLIYLNFI